MAEFSRRALQVAVGVAVLVPLIAGAAGAIEGPGMLDNGPAPDLDSHFRYLSGLLFAIGVAFAAAIPTIERQGARFRLLTGIVFAGGLSRLYGVAVTGQLTQVTAFALLMELGITPALAICQYRLFRPKPV
jgi:hypothetical protein